VTKSLNSNDYKFLYQKAEKEKIKSKVQKVKETYTKYEEGKIDFKDLKDVIVNDLQLSSNGNFDKLADSAARDCKNFTGLIRSLGILKDDKVRAPKFTANQMKNSTAKKYPRYVRNKSYNVPEHESNVIQDSVTSYLKRQITSQDLQTVLRDNNINPGVEEINKFVRNHDAGINVKMTDLLFAIKKIGNNGVDPSSVKVNFNPPKYYTTHLDDTTDSPKKKNVNPSYVSNKDMFDWEISEHQQILNKMEDRQVPQSAKSKFIHESTIFKKDAQSDEKKSALKKVDSPAVGGNGNILTWKGTASSDNSQMKEVKRRDPNACSVTDESTKAPKRKVLKMHESSEENGMIRKK